MHTLNQIIGLFPGQGSQKVGMGLELFGASEVARDVIERGDKALGFPLSEIMFHGPLERLTATAIAQPAILTVSVATFQVLKSIWPALKLSGAAGHSLGEYSALVAAGSLQFEDAVVLVHKRGTYMQEAVPSGQGKMVAVLGKEVREIEDILSQVTGIVQIANINAPGQIVVAGERSSVDEFVTKLGGAKVIELQVSAPFHCTLMKPAEEKLAKDLAQLNIQTANFPVYANYHARPLSAAEDIREALRLQVCAKVRWVECMQNVIADVKHSVQNGFQNSAAIEFGAGNVLAGLLKRIDASITRHSCDSLKSCGEVMQALRV